MTILRGRRRRLSILAVGLLAAASAPAQPVIQTPRQEFELRQPRVGEEPPPELVLPPIPPPAPTAPPAPGERVFVRAFRFEGNTVFDDAELAAVTAPWSGREIASSELRAARDAVTRHYVDAGYVSSGAVLPDQELVDGVVLLRIVEGRLASVQVEGARWFRASYFESRLLGAAGPPVRVQDLERRLEVFQQDDRLSRVSARLEPSAQRGESVLRLDVEEAFPLRLGLEWSNDVPPSLGEQAGRVDARLAGPLRVGDELFGYARFAEGLIDAEGGYGVPVNRFDTRLEARVRWSDGQVVEDPFEGDDVVSEVFTAGLGVLQPLWRTQSDEVRAALIGEWRRSQTDLFGEGFSFPGSGANSEGESTLAVLRIGGEWVHRARTRVFAVRQLVSTGLPILDATINPPGEPDRSFAAFLTQIRAAQRFERLYGIELVLRSDVQLATEPLMPMEQIGVGGVSSVRGYRENELVRDQAVAGSVEVRVPVWRDDERGHLVQLAPFFDAGYGWSASERVNAKEDSPQKSLFGVGIGVRYRYRRWLGAELYWGDSLSDVRQPSDETLQDHGIYFRVRVDVP